LWRRFLLKVKRFNRLRKAKRRAGENDEGEVRKKMALGFSLLNPTQTLKAHNYLIFI
jgi:hypothetical protein